MSVKRLFIILIAFLFFAFASSIYAMDSRKDVLDGGATGYNSAAGLVLDSADSFVNPSYILDYGNLIGIEGSSPALTSGFVFLDLNKNVGLPGSFGVQVGRNFGLLNQNSLANGVNINNFVGSLKGLAGISSIGSDGVSVTTLSNKNHGELFMGSQLET